MKTLKELVGDEIHPDSVIVLNRNLPIATKTEIEIIYPHGTNPLFRETAHELVSDILPKASTPAREQELPKSLPRTSWWRRSTKNLSLFIFGRKDK